MAAKSVLAAALMFGLFLSGLPARAAEPGEEPLADRVRAAIDKGVAYLRKEQKDRGGDWDWENTTIGVLQPGGATSLALLALLTSGVKPDDPTVKRGLASLRKFAPEKVYVVGIQTMVLEAVGDARDLDQIQTNVNWLIESRVMRGGKLEGWGYERRSGTPDNSNTQYALLGLWAGRQAGAKIDEEVWKSIQEFYIRTQNDAGRGMGGWGYHADRAFPSSQTMTAAGVCGLYIAALELNDKKQGLNEATGVAANCGQYDENDALHKGMRWLGLNFAFNTRGHAFYNIYGIERVGRLSGQRFIGEHDWYREGCEILTGVNPKYRDLAQHEDGSWGVREGLADGLPVISTSFALLFLSKGRTPILISKLAYDSPGGPNEWNRKHHDARHLAEYASRELFKRQPMAWQVFDPRPANLGDRRILDEELVSLLQSPILYLNGHKRPQLTDAQQELLKRYVEEGGFILAEACCGSEEFADGFRGLMNKLFPDTPLKPLGPDHPVWSAHALIKPTEFKLEGIERGCKTVVMFSPQPLAGYWEEGRFVPPPAPKPAIGRGQEAFRLAGNIIAYATGLEPPEPRLTKKKLTAKEDGANLPRHTLQIAQIRHSGDAEPAPAAMHNLASYLRDQYRLDVSLQKMMVNPGNEQLVPKFKFLYMHGRKKFQIDPEDLETLRFTLETGSVLLADACCGKKEFDESFRAFAKALFPNNKLEPIPLDDYLFSEKLNGQAIRKVNRRTENSQGKLEMNVDPMLEGIKVDGRWVVIYSRYDLGCALEKNKSSACLGHDEQSAQRLAGAAVLYALKR
jgi:hypothetical protein